MPPRKSTPDEDGATQFARFLEAVREVEADETDERLDQILKRLPSAKLPPKKP